jgi:hypothetical protein
MDDTHAQDLLSITRGTVIFHVTPHLSDGHLHNLDQSLQVNDTNHIVMPPNHAVHPSRQQA